MASRLFHIYDIRKMDTYVQERESSLKYMTRSLACMLDGQGEFFFSYRVYPKMRTLFTYAGYASASIEGRIAVEYFDTTPSIQDKKYAFKCHRQTVNDVDHVWPVNALAFHLTYNTFASAGSDGTVSIWDHKVKKRLKQYSKYPGPVAGVAFNCDGTKIAVGVSYTWDDGEQGMRTQNVTPWLGVKKVGDEVKVGFIIFRCVSCCLTSFLSFYLDLCMSSTHHISQNQLHEKSYTLEVYISLR
jgi:cell cycle arrest protein BUB3